MTSRTPPQPDREAGFLRETIRAILVEAPPPPDEPGVKPGEAMGRYLMPGERTELAYGPVELEALSYIYYDEDERDPRDIGGRKRDAAAAADLLAVLGL